MSHATSCAICDNPAQDQQLRFCSGCRQRKYCSEACQRAAWRAGHKEECRRLRARASAPSSAQASSSSLSSSPAAAAASTSRSAGGDGGGDPPSSASPTAPAHASSSRNKNLTTRATNGRAASAQAEHTNPTHRNAHAVPDDNTAEKKHTGVVFPLRSTSAFTIICFGCLWNTHKMSLISCYQTIQYIIYYHMCIFP